MAISFIGGGNWSSQRKQPTYCMVLTKFITINSNTNTNKYSGSTVSTPSLTVLNADQNDEANYVCFAVNSVGTGQSQQTFLDVTGSKFQLIEILTYR
jgi:hypothetical protein